MSWERRHVRTSRSRAIASLEALVASHSRGDVVPPRPSGPAGHHLLYWLEWEVGRLSGESTETFFIRAVRNYYLLHMSCLLQRDTTTYKSQRCIAAEAFDRRARARCCSPDGGDLAAVRMMYWGDLLARN